MECPDPYLKNKLCKIQGLIKSTSLNGQCAKVIEWAEKTGRITLKLKNDREIALKFGDIAMEDLEPIICNFQVRDKMQNCLKQSIQLAVPKLKLANKEDITKVFSNLTNTETQSIIRNKFVCSANNYNCNEKGLMCMSTPFFYEAQDKRSTHFMDALCVPICVKPACKAEAKRQLEMLIKNTWKMFPDFCDV